MNVRLIRTVAMAIITVFGLVANGILLHLIARFTPITMRVFSRLLVQTCVFDIVLLIFTALSDHIMFQLADGHGCITNGLLRFISIDESPGRMIEFVISLIWIYLLNAQVFGFCSQFMYRYLMNNRNVSLSLRTYSFIAVAHYAIPLVYIAVLGYCCFPRAQHLYLHDKSVASMLDLNLTTSNVSLNFFAAKNDTIMEIAFFYHIATSTLAYVLFIVLNILLCRYVYIHFKPESNFVRHRLERQLTKTLTVQCLLPLTVYLPLMLTLIAVTAKVGNPIEVQYYNMLAPILMYLPAAINPFIVFIFIRPYRRALQIFWRQ